MNWIVRIAETAEFEILNLPLPLQKLIFYVQNACVTDATLAPQGHSTRYILVPVTHQHPNVDWSKETPAFRENVLGPVSPQATRRHRSRCAH